MDLGNGLGHLSYSTLVHPGDTWAEMRDSLATYVPGGEGAGLAGPPVRRLVADLGRLGHHPHRGRRGAWPAGGVPGRARPVRLHRQRVPLRTVQGRQVMERVYEPDWTTEERVALYLPGRGDLGRDRPAERQSEHPDCAAGLPAQGRGRGVRRLVHDPAVASGRPSRRPGGAYRTAGEGSARARAGLLPGDHRRDGHLLP